MTGYSSERGWPVKQEDFDDFVFISGVVQKPTDVDEEGHIFLWVRVKDNPNKPYAIELPYSDELAKQVDLANLKSILEGEMKVDMTQFHLVKERKANVTEI
jgi:hypothetical protein